VNSLVTEIADLFGVVAERVSAFPGRCPDVESTIAQGRIEQPDA
jgi:hypothetical protein